MYKKQDYPGLRGGVRQYAAQETSQIDIEIGKKDHLGMETTFYRGFGRHYQLQRVDRRTH